MKDTKRIFLSLREESACRQFWAGIALASVIPILALYYLYSRSFLGMLARGPWQENFFYVLCVLVIAGTGCVLLGWQPAHILTVRKTLEESVQKALAGNPSIAATPNDIAMIDRHLAMLIDQLILKAGAAEQERNRLQQQMFQAQKIESLSTMATGIAHDFNNYFSAISGNIHIAIRHLPESPAREHVIEAENAVLQAEGLTNQLLIAAGRGRLSPEMLDFSTVITGMADSLKSAAPAGVDLCYRLSDELPSIKADRTLIELAITQLVLNAADSYLGQSGAVTLLTGAMDCSRDYLSQALLAMNFAEGKYVYIEVSDRGMGVPPDLHARLFDPFFSVHMRGRGMCLPMVLGVARSHFAALMVKSQPGEGNTFRILFQSGKKTTAAV